MPGDAGQRCSDWSKEKEISMSRILKDFRTISIWDFSIKAKRSNSKYDPGMDKLYISMLYLKNW